jgi:hypothetical protein
LCYQNNDDNSNASNNYQKQTHTTVEVVSPKDSSRSSMKTQTRDRQKPLKEKVDGNGLFEIVKRDRRKRNPEAALEF